MRKQERFEANVLSFQNYSFEHLMLGVVLTAPGSVRAHSNAGFIPRPFAMSFDGQLD